LGLEDPSRDAGSRSAESRTFVMKAARSVAELQPRVNNVADVMVFLEVLGYTRQDAQKNGFDDLNELSREIYEFVDILEGGEEDHPSSHESYVKLPTTARRIGEGLALSFGWVGALLLLFIAGVSVWLSLLLPLKVTTVFMAGLFAGIFITEGPLQGFNRFFAFYHNQGNLAEARRVLKRAYLVVGTVLAVTVGGLYALAVLTSFPIGLFEIGMISLIGVSLQRVIYAIIYTLRKMVHLVVSYSLAFSALLLVYFEMGALIPNDVSRYFYALFAALAVLSSFAFYDQLRLLKGDSFRVESNAPSFFRQGTTNKSTIRSRFSVQLWESLPNYLYGAFFFVLIFGDRVLSWFFNPIKTADGVALPFVFNTAYHLGADPALLVIFPALIIQYAMMSPVFGQVSNATLEYSVSEAYKIQPFLLSRYRKVMLASVASAVAVAAALDLLTPKLMPATALNPTSLQILHIASFANVLLVVFFANGVFMLFMNRMMGLAMIAMVGALVVLGGGLILVQTGFQNLEIAYLVATAMVAALSTVYVGANIGRAASIFFARFM
jgi:hypothetical protein